MHASNPSFFCLARMLNVSGSNPEESKRLRWTSMFTFANKFVMANVRDYEHAYLKTHAYAPFYVSGIMSDMPSNFMSPWV